MFDVFEFGYHLYVMLLLDFTVLSSMKDSKFDFPYICLDTLLSLS